MMRMRVALVLCALMTALGATPADAQPSLSAARQLYAAAAYEDALAVLNGLALESRTADDQQAIGLYRVLCLVALGRAADAAVAMEALVTHHPLYRPGSEDLSPRIRAAFIDARRRLLPGLIQQRYAHGKAAFDRKDFAAAAASFTWVLGAMTDPDIADAAAQSPLSDVGTLAGGFHHLAKEALAPPPLPEPVPVAAPPPPPVRDYRRVYTADDPDVVPPAIIRQAFPAFPGRLTRGGVGIIEVVIDATGAVESATLEAPVHPQYDRLALTAAKRWQYQPATIDGVPVKFLKRVQITLTPMP